MYDVCLLRLATFACRFMLLKLPEIKELFTAKGRLVELLTMSTSMRCLIYLTSSEFPSLSTGSHFLTLSEFVFDRDEQQRVIGGILKREKEIRVAPKENWRRSELAAVVEAA